MAVTSGPVLDGQCPINHNRASVVVAVPQATPAVAEHDRTSRTQVQLFRVDTNAQLPAGPEVNARDKPLSLAPIMKSIIAPPEMERCLTSGVWGEMRFRLDTRLGVAPMALWLLVGLLLGLATATQFVGSHFGHHNFHHHDTHFEDD